AWIRVEYVDATRRYRRRCLRDPVGGSDRVRLGAVSRARSRRRAEYGAFVEPAVGDHRNDLALARQVAVPDLAAHEIVVQAHDRDAVGRAIAGRRRLFGKRLTLEYPSRTGGNERAFGRIDRVEVRVRARTRLAEEAARRNAVAGVGRP